MFLFCMNTNPHLEIIIGTMFSGKSTELIRRVNRYEVAGKKVQLFKPTVDDRYSVDYVASHDGLMKEVFHVRNVEELKKAYNPLTEVLGIDEPQFLESEIIDVCQKHVNNGGICVAAFLLKDCFDNFFKFNDGKRDTSEFVRIADHVTYLRAICTYRDNGDICGQEATRVQRFGLDGKPDLITSPVKQVGGKKDYAPRCRKHYQFI